METIEQKILEAAEAVKEKAEALRVARKEVEAADVTLMLVRDRERSAREAWGKARQALSMLVEGDTAGLYVD